MLSLTVTILARRVAWHGGDVFATAAPLPKAPPPVRPSAVRGVGEAPSFAALEIELVQITSTRPAEPAPVDARQLRAWWRMTGA